MPSQELLARLVANQQKPKSAYELAWENGYRALYTVYILNRSGQTISANWTLKLLPAEAQYT